MLINCDIGERGADHAQDREIMQYIDMANIACGGHAGDEQSIATFVELAKQNDVQISAHLSYPDRDHFGRESIQLDPTELIASLDEQLNRLPESLTVKFHGALYHDSSRDAWLAHLLAHWLRGRGVKTLIAAPGSEMLTAAQSLGISVLKEGFVDRRYSEHEQGLRLEDRSIPGSELCFEDAVSQANELSAGRLQGSVYCVQTLCIHSDGTDSLELAKTLSPRMPPFSMVNPGISSIVSDPDYGQQHLGRTPGGAQDRFSFACGKRLLGQSYGIGLEWVSPPQLKIDRPAIMILLGAETEAAALIRGQNLKPVFHAQIFEVKKGDVLSFSKTVIGFRGYILWRDLDESSREKIGQKRPKMKSFASFRKATGPIRIFPGPERDWLSNPDELVIRPWKMSDRQSAMGVRLDPVAGKIGELERSMLSAPVTDGTIQWTPSGPIILMRHRQTVGGYPRVAQVCDVDLDRVAQYRPGDAITFRWITLEEANELLAQQQKALNRL